MSNMKFSIGFNWTTYDTEIQIQLLVYQHSYTVIIWATEITEEKYFKLTEILYFYIIIYFLLS